MQTYPEDWSEREKKKNWAQKDLFVTKTNDGMDYVYTKNEGQSVVTDAKYNYLNRIRL